MPSRLSDLEIDEVSLVYKGANQHSRVAIAKSADAQEAEMDEEIFDGDGNPVDPGDLEHGDVVFGSDGQAYQYDESEGDEDETEEVGKSWEDISKGRLTNAKKKVGDKWSLGVEGFKQAAGKTLPAQLGTRRGKVGKSFADDMRVELSKALTDTDRDEVISKAFGYVEYLETVAKSAHDQAVEEREIRREAEFLEVAKSYSLPVSDEELARVMKNCADALDEDDVAVIAKCFQVASDAIYDELGASGGGTNSGVMAQIEDYANTAVEKSDGQLNGYDVVSKAMEANPDLYEAYLEETGYYNR